MKEGTQAIQLYTGVTFTFNGREWVCNRNSNVKISNKDFKYEELL